MSSLSFRTALLLPLALACSQPTASSERNTPSLASSASQHAPPAPLRSPDFNEPPEPAARTDGSPLSAKFARFHPRGRWRLASPAAFGQAVIWADHLLIRHDRARDEVSFNLAYWYSVPPTPARNREQALVLAREIAAAAARDPDSFAELARRHSEELPSRDEGGARGGFALSQLSSWPQVLDAFAATRPGQTSNVVETYYGFHIFRRLDPPPEQTLSGAHIVIGHDRAEWLKMLARGPLPQRSREDALALANELYGQAAAQPERFQELVERYSEHRDALIAGDFGSWSSREPNPFPTRMRRLEQLAVGAVGAPVETHVGFEIILRTEARPREQLAVRAAQLPFDPSAPEGSESSRARVLARAEALARSYAAEPARFGAPGELPTFPQQWPSGRGVPAVELQVLSLAPGEVAASAAQSEFSFQLSQRWAPEPVASEHYETELPAPTEPDLEYHASTLTVTAWRELLLDGERLAQPELRLSAARLARLRQLHENATLPEPSESSEAAVAVQRVLHDTRALLGPAGHAVYLSALKRQLASQLLEGPDDSASERGM